MSSTEVSVEEEIKKALAALEKACQRLTPKEDSQKTKGGSEDKGDRKQQV